MDTATAALMKRTVDKKLEKFIVSPYTQSYTVPELRRTTRRQGGDPNIHTVSTGI